MRKSLLFAVPILTMAADAPYVQKVETWRKNYESGLRAPSGWLEVAGLAWLREGANSMGSSEDSRVVLPKGAPAHTEPLVMSAGQVTYEGKSLEIDKSVLKFNDATLTVIKRGDRIGVRLRDLNAATRTAYYGSNWYPIDSKWRVTATWVPNQKTISIVNILGKVELEFNQAKNAPCAFTSYATCPFPPRQNAMPIAVEAGEKNYGKH